MDSEKIKEFVVYNFEKGIVALVVLMAGFLIYSGFGQPIITDTYDPQKLATDAGDVERQVDDDHTAAIIEDGERVPTFDIAKEQSKFREPIKPAFYQNVVVWDRTKDSVEKIRRTDPEISKPVGIELEGVVASLAYRSRDGAYALTELEPADELEKVETKPKARPRRNRRQPAMDDGGYGGGYGEMDMEMMEMEMQMMESEMYSDYGSDASASSGSTRKLAAENNLGLKPATTQAFDSGVDQPPVPGVGLFIAGTAAIPHKELIDAYQESFSMAADYDPIKRDRPLYVAYQLQRADVTDKSVDQLQDSDWIIRDSNELTIWNAANYWSGFAPEIVPADYTIDGVTMWIPPVVLDPYQSFATNSLVPLKSQRDLEREQQVQEAEEEATSSGPASREDYEIDLAGGNTRRFGGMGMEDYGSEMGMEDYGMDGGMMDYGGGSAGSMYAGKPAEDNPVDYKLLRFYDFYFLKGAKRDPNRPRRGRTYVYRVRYAVNDPNFPKDPMLQPKGSTLDPDAYKRYAALSADAEKNQKRDFRRWSEWSEISAPISLPQLDRSTFGPVKTARMRKATKGSRQILVETEPPTAEVVASSFDPRLEVFVPTLIEATEGTVLSKQAETADVVDPITLEVKKTENAIISSTATVIDVEGGVPLEIIEDEKITSPGMFLMTDSDGNLHVRDAAEEQRLYRIRSFAKERGL